MTDQDVGALELGYGFALDAGIGHAFANHLRAEVTCLFSTYSAGADSLSSGSLSYATGGDTFSGNDTVSGRVKRNSILASVYYAIPAKLGGCPTLEEGWH